MYEEFAHGLHFAVEFNRVCKIEHVTTTTQLQRGTAQQLPATLKATFDRRNDPRPSFQSFCLQILATTLPYTAAVLVTVESHRYFIFTIIKINNHLITLGRKSALFDRQFQ